MTQTLVLVFLTCLIEKFLGTILAQVPNFYKLSFY